MSAGMCMSIPYTGALASIQCLSGTEPQSDVVIGSAGGAGATPVATNT